MKKKVSIFSLWLATFMMLSVTILSHHHHFQQACFMEDICQMDDHIDDGCTAHHSSENEAQTDNCSVEQIKHVIKSEKSARQITQAISRQAHLLYAFSPSKVLPSIDVSLFCEASTEPTVRLLEVYVSFCGLRAPPIL